MAWELRGGIRYFYRSEWKDGRSIKCYFGRGPVGLLAEQIDEQVRLRKGAQAESIRIEAARLAYPEAAQRALDSACNLMVEAALTIAGYHRHNYGQWRRCRARTRS